MQAALVAAGLRIDACLQHRALVRYDAYVDAGGRQSTSIALLDARGSGLVVSAIQDRSYARIYVKDVALGLPADVAFSPEEQQAVDAARKGPVASEESQGPQGSLLSWRTPRSEVLWRSMCWS